MHRLLWLVLAACLAGNAGTPVRAQDGAAPAAAERASVHFDGEPLFEVRGAEALPAEQRARAITARLTAAARDPGFDPAAIELRPAEDWIEIRGSTGLLLRVYESDAALEGLDLPVLADAMRARIGQAVGDYRAGRSPAGIRRAILIAAAETLVFAAVLAALVLLWRATSRLIERRLEHRIAAWEGRAQSVVRLRYLWQMALRALRLVFVILALIALYAYLDAVLLALPWTRDAGRAALTAVTAPLRELGTGILHAVPNLIALALIVAATVAIFGVVGRFFALVGAGSIRLTGFEPEWALPTQRLVRVGIVLLAAMMAYPYIPGSSSEAFKAISIFAGIMFSLGSSSVIANLIAGYSMIYRRAFRVGDRVEIAGVTGDVEELRLQDTWIRTARNERVTLPNSLVLASQVINFTHMARQSGLILHTEIGIGYEVPWRRVEALLLEAARRTPGIAAEPPPFVRQKRLGEFAPLYELNATTHDEKAMEATYSALHANIQDVFAEAGVQIMTPSYEGDPEVPKVPPAQGR